MANPFGEDSYAGRNYGSTSERSSQGDTSERFAQTRRQIEKATQDIRQQTNQLRQLLAAIGTPNDDIELRRRITNLRESAFKLVTETSQLFMSIVGDTGQEMAARALQRQFSQIADEFSRVYESIVNKLQEYPRPVVRHSLRESKAYSSSGELAVEGDNVRLTRADILQQEHEQEQEQQYVETEASYAENRLQEMRVLQENMVTLHEIMTSMQRQVVIQGEDIDGIEQNVESAAGDISEGNRQLGTAVKYKRCSRKLTIVIVIVCSVIVVGLILTIIIGVCVAGHCGGGKS